MMQKNNHVMSGRKFNWLMLVGLVVLTGCGGDAAQEIPGQKWQGVEVRVEIRPAPPRVGMNEFLVLTTNERGRPVYDLMVSLRTSERDEWKQAIQDGQVGVYRRAAEIAPGERSVLQVQLRRNGVEGVLKFPLNAAN